MTRTFGICVHTLSIDHSNVTIIIMFIIYYHIHPWKIICQIGIGKYSKFYFLSFVAALRWVWGRVICGSIFRTVEGQIKCLPHSALLSNNNTELSKMKFVVFYQCSCNSAVFSMSTNNSFNFNCFRSEHSLSYACQGMYL